MFCINEKEILIGPENSSLSHHEWFNKLGYDANKLVEESVRGFKDERGLFFYKGPDFNIDPKTEKIFFKKLGEIQKLLNLPEETRIYGGVTPTKNTIYLPQKTYGTIKDNKKNI